MAFLAYLLAKPAPVYDVCLDTDSTGQGRTPDGNGPNNAWLPRAMDAKLAEVGWPFTKPLLRYVGTVDSSEFFPSGRCFHDIVSGQTLVDGLLTLDARLNLFARAPTYYFVLLGANDLANGRTRTQVIADLITYVGKVQTRWPTTQVIVITPKPNNINNAINTEILALGADIVGGAVTNANGVISLLDFPVTTACAPDNFHPKTPNSPNLAATWEGSVPDDTFGIAWIAERVLEFLIPGTEAPAIAA